MCKTIISGGRSGAEIAAVDVAIELGIDIKGYCIPGRINDALRSIPGVLAEARSVKFIDRTRDNIAMAGMALIFQDKRVNSAAVDTIIVECAAANVPVVFLNFHDFDTDISKVIASLRRAESIYVTGHSEPNRSGTYSYARSVMTRAVIEAIQLP